MTVPAHLGATAATDAVAENAVPIVAFRGLKRNFGETVALADCSFGIRPGEIHALVGENGSGKSTLIKILSGILPQSGGELAWDGGNTRFRDPRGAQRAGVATVFQETLVLDQLSVRDNVSLGLDGLFRRAVTRAEEARLVRQVLDTIGMSTLNIEVPVAALSLAQRQCVTIARALTRPWRLLVLDESTSALDVEARDRLFEALRRFRGEGRSILFVSHRMDEILEIADRSTVLRSGRSVATLTRAETTTATLLGMMSTQEEARAAEGGGRAAAGRNIGERVIEAKGIVLPAGRSPFDLDVRAGEIVGIAGLVGCGKSELIRAVFGLEARTAGTIRCYGREFADPSPHAALRLGVCYFPSDRVAEGLAIERPIRE
ncbi:MAG: ATP-binding cassette domain-containing protein, partial [Stellaceae bacterium]